MTTRVFSAPFFEVGPKTFLSRRQLLELASDASEAAIEYDVAVIMTTPALDIEKVKARTPTLWVFAQHVDPKRPGRSTGAIVPEALRDVGADGVMLNHFEKPLSFDDLTVTIERAHEVELLTLVCADTDADAERYAALHPQLLLAEPPHLIGAPGGIERPWIRELNDRIARIDRNILVMHSGGIGSSDDVYNVIREGASGTGATSAIVNSPQPGLMARNMIRAVREAWNDRHAEDS
jgi:triosephosphate isomerase